MSGEITKIETNFDKHLPFGWTQTTLGELIFLEYGKGLKKENRNQDGEYEVYGSSGLVGKHNKPLIKEACIIVGRKGTAGSVYLALKPSWPIDTVYFVIPPSGLEIRFLYYLLSHLNLGHLDKSTAIPGLNRNDAYRTKCLLPPTNEQRRIVAKIEELFSHLDAGVQALEKAKALLKQYRQSVLKAAVTGELTRDWREQNKDKLEPADKLLARILTERRRKWEAQELAKMRAKGKEPKDDTWKQKYKSPAAPDTRDLPELPEGWCWVRIEQIGYVQLGRQRSPKNRSKDYPTNYIRAANITENGLDFSDLLDMEFTPDEFERYKLKDGDVVLSEASGSPDQVGKPAIWRNQIENCCFQNTVIRLRPTFVSEEYLLIVFKHFYHNKIFSRVAGGVGINHLSASKFSSMAMPLPSLSEQSQIYSEVERVHSIIDNLEKVLRLVKSKSHIQRQSILQHAFSGQLVPQDPYDEPASVMLERIEAEKAKLTAQKAKHTPKTKKQTPAMQER